LLLHLWGGVRPEGSTYMRLSNIASARGTVAVQDLLNRDMSEKVYIYLSTLSGFLAFTIFVGYFPDFKKDSEDPHNEYLRKIEDKYPPGEKMEQQPTIEDMTYIINTEKAEIMLEFREIEISVDLQEDRINYWLGLDSIYLKEK